MLILVCICIVIPSKLLNPAEHVPSTLQRQYEVTSHELPLLLTAVKAQMMETYQPYVTELCEQHLEKMFLDESSQSFI